MVKSLVCVGEPRAAALHRPHSRPPQAEINRHAEMHLVAALDAVPGFRSVLCLHETVAAGAADGYGRLVGGRAPAACLLHLGPGLANACAALHNARRARSPLLVLVGDMVRARSSVPWGCQSATERR